jgi:hypothetical protein
MTTHNHTAYAAVANAVKKRNVSGKNMYTNAKRTANTNYKGSGNNNNMIKNAARYLKNHPGSKNAEKLLNHALKN